MYSIKSTWLAVIKAGNYSTWSGLGFLDTEHLFMLPKTWLEYQQYADVHVEFTKDLYNAYCTQKNVFVEKDFESWVPKIHSPCNYLQIFYVTTIIE